MRRKRVDVQRFPDPLLAPDYLGLRRLYTPVLREFEDRRLFHPAGELRPAGVLSERLSRRIIAKSSPVSLRDDISARVGFAVPSKVVVCVRRKQRRETLFATGGAGAGRRVSKQRRRTALSSIDCK